MPSTRWLPTPYITISMGLGSNAKSQLIFTTLTSLNSRKYISDVTITQTSHTTVKYNATLLYYPSTFGRAISGEGVPDVLEAKLKLAIEEESTEKIYIQFGYTSNSPYNGARQASPTYVGLITSLKSTVEENYIKYDLEAYGVDIALGYFITVNKDIEKTLEQDLNIETYLKETLLNNGDIVVDSMNFHFKIDIEDVNLNRTFSELLLEGIDENMEILATRTAQDIAASFGNRPMGYSNNNINKKVDTDITKAISDLKKYQWEKIKKSISFKNLTNGFIDSSNATNLSSGNVENTVDRNQFSAYEAVEIINRLINYNVSNKNYNLRCVIEPWCKEEGYDGTIRIFNAIPNYASQKEFFWGTWTNSTGYISNQSNVISWNCNYNSTAQLFSSRKFKTSLYGNINTELELTLDEDGNVHYNLVSSQTKSTATSDYRATVDKNTQYDMVIKALNTVLDYPYEATITVLGITDPLKIAKDTIKVNVFVNGTKHFTSGIYMITGYSNNISNNGFTTTYQLIKIPQNSTLAEQQQISKDILGKTYVNNPTTEKASLYYNNKTS